MWKRDEAVKLAPGPPARSRPAGRDGYSERPLDRIDSEP